MNNPDKIRADATEISSGDGVDRRGFLKCMAWAGTGVVWTFAGGVPLSQAFGTSSKHAGDASFSFVQISDSHIGFDKPANVDVTATLQAAIDKISALPVEPDLILHTGDLSHLSRPGEFDTLDQVLKGVHPKQIFYVPGEHDVALDNGRQFLDRYGKGTQGGGWQSFDHKGVHFVGLVNVLNFKPGGLGVLGHEQLEWLEEDLKGRTSSTPIVVFAHIPLWAAYPEWGWATEDSAQALAYLKRFGSVTVLNGHIHQIMQKVEGNVTFHTAMATAFPQPVAGTASSAGPLKVPADQLRRVLGITNVNFVAGNHPLAVVDATLAGTPPEEVSGILRKAAAALPAAAAQSQSNQSQPKAVATGETIPAAIDNFSFTPKEMTVKAGTTVRWTNKDDIPHTVTSDNNVFASPVLDSNQNFQFTFASAGKFTYFCRLHPKMTGEVVVR
ncbi:MAG: metallophosphoesterase [Acidobacteriia bacterium]|nr:metallophosphoesterase [Terriglobia bacterium]